jgi:NADH-quinone oxidoreductase subunit C
MFGIFFINNPDLRRILTDYGFNYNPLLKEFPVKGFFELKYYSGLNIIQYVPVNDFQEAKIYDFKNP